MSDKQVRRGDIYWCPVMEINEGGELYVGTPRPVVVVSNDKCNESSSNITVVPITSQEKKPLPIHVEVSVGKINGTALCEKVSIAIKDNPGYFCGVVPNEKMREIEEALAFQLSLERATIHVGANTDRCLNIDIQTALIKQERDLYKKLYEQILEKTVKG